MLYRMLTHTQQNTPIVTQESSGPLVNDLFLMRCNNNNNNNNNNNYYYYYYYLLKLGCHPVAVIILHVYKTRNCLTKHEIGYKT